MFMPRFIISILYNPCSVCRLFPHHADEQVVKPAIFTHQQSEAQALVQGH